MNDWRAIGFERLLTERFDLLLVGGGIIGALTADDILRRRTTLILTGRASDAVRARVEAPLAS